MSTKTKENLTKIALGLGVAGAALIGTYFLFKKPKPIKRETIVQILKDMIISTQTVLKTITAEELKNRFKDKKYDEQDLAKYCLEEKAEMEKSLQAIHKKHNVSPENLSKLMETQFKQDREIQRLIQVYGMTIQQGISELLVLNIQVPLTLTPENVLKLAKKDMALEALGLLEAIQEYTKDGKKFEIQKPEVQQFLEKWDRETKLESRKKLFAEFGLGEEQLPVFNVVAQKICGKDEKIMKALYEASLQNQEIVQNLLLGKNLDNVKAKIELLAADPKVEVAPIQANPKTEENLIKEVIAEEVKEAKEWIAEKKAEEAVVEKLNEEVEQIQEKVEQIKEEVVEQIKETIAEQPSNDGTNTN